MQSVLDIFTRNNVLNTLDVSGTSCVGEQVLMTLHGGFYEQLTYLGLANNKFTLKKTKDYKPPPTLTQVFQTAASLRTLDLAESKIPAEGLRAIFVGCAQNSLLSDVHVNLRGCECEAAAGSVLVDMLPKLACLHRLDLSSNGKLGLLAASSFFFGPFYSVILVVTGSGALSTMDVMY